MPAGSPYRLLAEYYDRLFGFGIPWSESARAKLLGHILPRVKAACDLACGTGTTAVALARSGIKMYAVDLSPTMCRLARQKGEKAGVFLRVLRADMRAFKLPEPVDLILCEFDAINHVPRTADLGLVAASAARALRPGGYFYFDVNTRLAFKTLWPRAWWIEQPDFALVLHGGYDRARDKAWTNAEWFFREGRHWRRRKERIEQVCWSATEIRSVLLKAGFDRIRAFDGTPFLRHSPGMRRGCRTFYLARKG
jgi:SAM-dependent methyltransferase